MQDRRARGLCFNCDEKFVSGHRCKKLFLIEGIYEEGEDWEGGGPTEIEGNFGDEPVISQHAITRMPTSQMMRVTIGLPPNQNGKRH